MPPPLPPPAPAAAATAEATDTATAEATAAAEASTPGRCRWGRALAPLGERGREGGGHATPLTDAAHPAGKLALAGGAKLEDKQGPRHLVFHPRCRTAYVINELKSTVSVGNGPQGPRPLGASCLETPSDAPSLPPALVPHSLSLLPSLAPLALSPNGLLPPPLVFAAPQVLHYHPERLPPGSPPGGGPPTVWDARSPGGGAFLAHAQTLRTLPPDFESSDHHKSHASEIRLHPSGRFLLIANRGHDSIAVYAVDESSSTPVAARGTLRTLHITPSGGAFPRNFNFDATGRFVVVGNQNSNNLTVFSFDTVSGSMLPVDTKYVAVGVFFLC